jgi:hypothetical protein
MEQTIRFCTAPDGVRLAYATSGAGPPLVKTANWLTHLEYDWESPVWRHLFRALSSHHLLLRYDDRGNGLSERECGDISFDAWVRDFPVSFDALVSVPEPTLFGHDVTGFQGTTSENCNPKRRTRCPEWWLQQKLRIWRSGKRAFGHTVISFDRWVCHGWSSPPVPATELPCAEIPPTSLPT